MSLNGQNGPIFFFGLDFPQNSTEKTHCINKKKKMQNLLHQNYKLSDSMIQEVKKHNIENKSATLDFLFEFTYLTHDEFLPILEKYLPKAKWLPEFFLSAEDYRIYTESTEALAKALSKVNNTYNRNKRESERVVIRNLPTKTKKVKVECVGCGYKHFMYDFYFKSFVCQECLAIQEKQKYNDLEFNVRSRMMVQKPNPVTPVYSRLATFVFFLRRYQGICPLKANPEEFDNIKKILLKEYGSLDKLSFKSVKLLLYKLKYNHLFSNVYTLLHELGSPRIRYSYSQIEEFKNQFSLWEVSGENEQHKSSLHILYAIATN